MSCVYRIECLDKSIPEFYIGSTFNLSVRIDYHTKYNFHRNFKVYDFIRDNGGWDNWIVMILEDIDYDISKEELFKKEQDWMDKLNPSLNSQRAFGHDRVKYQKEYFESYYPENREKILENAKQYYENNKEKVLVQRKKHYEKNKVEHNKKTMDYYYKNKEKISKQGKVKINCSVCNKLINKGNMKRHLKLH